MKLTAKLALGFGLVLSLNFMLGGFSSRSMQTSATHAEALSGRDLASIKHYLDFEGNLILSCLGTRTYGYTAKSPDREFGERYLAFANENLKRLRALAEKNDSAELQGRVASLELNVQEFTRLSQKTIRITDEMSADKTALNTVADRIQSALDKLNDTLLQSAATSAEASRTLLAFNNDIQRVRLATWHGIANRSVADLIKANQIGAPLLPAIKRYRDAAAPADRAQWSEIYSLTEEYLSVLNRFSANWQTFDESNSERFAVVTRTLEMIVLQSESTLNAMTALGRSTADQLTTSARHMWIGLALTLLIGVAITLLLTRSLTGAIRSCVQAVQRLAAGDLTAEVGLKRADELGTLAAATDACIVNLRQLVGNLTDCSADLLRSAKVLTDTSHRQAAAAEETTVQANTVASAGEELSINSKTMADSATQITQSTGTVAAAMEEMSSSIQEVARNCAQESEIARKADTQARQTRELMGKLDESARQIGKVVELINRIADQTNLLALNATIEAASAGEAGRGFAVVANEVKELARQSASATEDIRKQVALIQENAGASMRSLDEVAKVIEQVSHISSSIAAAVEEQSATTSEIVGTIHQVSTATSSLSQNVQQTADGAAEVARNISGVSQAASDGAKGAALTSSSAAELGKLAANLGQLVARFKV